MRFAYGEKDHPSPRDDRPYAILEFASSSHDRLAPFNAGTDSPAAQCQQILRGTFAMWRLHSQKWMSSVLVALAIHFGLGGRPAQADHHGHTQTYDVVQGYIIQPQAQAGVTVQSPAPTAAMGSGQNQGATSSLTPTAPQPASQTVTLQLTPAQAPVQTLQLTPAPVQVQTLQLTPAPVQVQMLQLAVAPVQVQTLQLAPQCQTATPVTILIPRHRCHWFCKHRN
jgi:hypothetical protein